MWDTCVASTSPPVAFSVSKLQKFDACKTREGCTCWYCCTAFADGLLLCAGVEAAASPSGRQPTTESAEKLDALMGLVFEHLGRRCEAGQLRAAWETTLHTFQRTILHTHRSKFTQYLLWYLCEKARRLHPPTCQSHESVKMLGAVLYTAQGVNIDSPSSPCWGSCQSAPISVQGNCRGSARDVVTEGQEIFRSQFVIVQDPKHCSVSLVQLLLGQLTSPNMAPITRSAAAAYVASFLARAALVPENVLIESLQVRHPCFEYSPCRKSSYSISSLLVSCCAAEPLDSQLFRACADWLVVSALSNEDI